MELSLVLVLCVAGCSLSWALPIQMNGADITATSSGLHHDNRTIFELIEQVNRGLTIPLDQGDINRKRSRSVTKCEGCLWKKSPNGMVQVPYVLSSVYLDYEKSIITDALKEFEVMTCVQFVSRTTEQDYLSIESESGCWSYIGKVGGKQTVSLSQSGCILYGIVQHEVMHNLGFHHEQTRTDRDDYIDILWQNISPGNRGYFKIDFGNTQNLTYDWNSVMHYGKYAYSSVPGQPSMVPKPDPTVPIGQQIGMSNLDVMKINNIYNCNLCTTKLIDTSGSFSYNSTSSEQGGDSCLWLIQSVSRVLLQLSDINVPPSPDCSNGYIKVYDGFNKLSPVLLETCDNGPVPPLISSGRNMLVEFVKGHPEVLSSFSASYDTVMYGGTYVSNQGKVASPFFPFFYPSNAEIVWSISAPKGCKVALTFKLIIMLYSPTCSLDYLIIRDGPLKTSPILGKFCGTIGPPIAPVVSTGNVMVLQFHSGKNEGYNGFTSNYQCVTGN